MNSSSQHLVWKINPSPASPIRGIVSRWIIDRPANSGEFSAEKCLVTGWALAADAERQGRLHAVLRIPGDTRSHLLETHRADVVKDVLKADPADHPCAYCGFEIPFTKEQAEAGFEIGFETDGLIQTVAALSLVGKSA